MATPQVSEAVPQIISITPLRRDYSIVLKKVVREHLGLPTGGVVSLRVDDEVQLYASSGSAPEGTNLPVDKRGKLLLPPAALDALGGAGPTGLAAGDQVALLQRPEGLVIKRVRVELTEGSIVSYTDVETAHSVVRRVEANPLPEDAVPALIAQAAELQLRADLKDYLRDRPTYYGWCARQTMGWGDSDDESLCQSLIDERLAAQHADGAWGGDAGSPIQTARMLRELADLGVSGDHPDVRRAADWLMARSSSEYNPGQWFGSDDLIAEQARVMAARAAMTRGTKPRFRQIRASEQNRIRGGDDLVVNPCGPRIMWPNGLVLDALLRLGYEDSPRVQTALGFMRTQDWCECGYQNGTFGRREQPRFSGKRLAAFESECKDQYRYGGLRDPAEIMARDMAHQPVRFQRVAADATPEGTTYALKIDHHIQGCEFITTRSLASVQDPEMRRFAEAHLWRFAGQQLADGTFPPERHGTGFGDVGILEVLSRYPHHPVTPVVILRALPWLVDTQRADGAWEQPQSATRGGDPRADATTLAVVKVLNAVRQHLPDQFWRAA